MCVVDYDIYDYIIAQIYFVVGVDNYVTPVQTAIGGHRLFRYITR